MQEDIYESSQENGAKGKKKKESDKKHSKD